MVFEKTSSEIFLTREYLAICFMCVRLFSKRGEIIGGNIVTLPVRASSIFRATIALTERSTCKESGFKAQYMDKLAAQIGCIDRHLTGVADQVEYLCKHCQQWHTSTRKEERNSGERLRKR